MARPARRGRPWRTALRAALRFGLPAAGLLVVGHAGLRSVGGDIERWEFALGLLLIAGAFAGKLVPER